MPILRIDDDIVLKILKPEDADSLFSLVDSNRFYLRQWLPWVDTNATLENSKHFIQSTIEQHELNLGFQCGIWFHDTFAGIIGFQRIDWMNRNVEIGYWLGEKFQGHGIMTKACRTLVDFAFYEYQLHRVQIRCATGNTKSHAIIERLGFIKEGKTRQAEFLYDLYVDLYIYGMTADEWKARYGETPNKMEWVL
jgi:ribosomal-protein-serine acetyltransferase